LSRISQPRAPESMCANSLAARFRPQVDRHRLEQNRRGLSGAPDITCLLANWFDCLYNSGPQNSSIMEFRADIKRDVWHFVHLCSGWPAKPKNFLRLAMLPTDLKLCPECQALSIRVISPELPSRSLPERKTRAGFSSKRRRLLR